MRGAKPLLAIEQSVKRDGAIHAGEHVLIACSGGSDSVALAAILQALSKTLRLRLTLAHVNHGVRASAWQDEAVVLRVSAALGLPLKVMGLQLSRRDEAAMREARYEALEQLAREAGASVVATGHTASDQTETVLLALFRGAGADGLAGMPARRRLGKDLELARPLLRLERDELRSYVQLAGLPYAIDPTNADRTLRRNAVRMALEALRPLFPGLDAAVARAAEVVGAELGATPLAAARRQVREALREHEALGGVDFEHVEAAVRALQQGASGRFFMAPGVEIEVANGALVVQRK
jgi:tRNA(Ile)-lysidine synthase